MPDIPIPHDTAQVFRAAGRNCRNLGLLFDRFTGYGPDWSQEGGQKHDEARRLVDECNRWAGDPAYKGFYDGICARWEKVMQRAGATPFIASPEWRLVVGLGRDSAFETGLTLHRVYGCPYIPGSALKGMTQAWAEAKDMPDAERREMFGVQECAGGAVFFDALPSTPPRLKLDVMNPHYPDYYRPGERKYPSDWQSPVPVFFITVEKGTRFLFGVGRRDGDENKAGTARDWLQRALREMGVGGKTTSGYGYWNF
jgi:CRISPR-associated protein Cmr6